jgi:hypothetical protein
MFIMELVGLALLFLPSYRFVFIFSINKKQKKNTKFSKTF